MSFRSHLLAALVCLTLGLCASAAAPDVPPAPGPVPAPAPDAAPGGEDKVFTWPEVVQCGLEKGRFTLTTPLPMVETIPWPVIKIAGLADKATIRHRPMLFELTAMPENAKLGTAERMLRLESRDDHLLINYIHPFGDQQVVNVNVIQLSEGKTMFQLAEGEALVSYYKGKAPANKGMQMIKAATFLRLRLENPQVIDEFVRPMFESFQGASALVPPLATAQQVLAEPKAADALAAEVAKLVKALDSDDAAARDKAAAGLLVLGAGTLEALKAVDQAKLSETQKKAVTALLANPDLLPTPVIDKLRKNVHFLLDCLLVEDEGVRSVAAKLLPKATDKKFEWDEKVKNEERPAAVAKLRELLAPAVKLEPVKGDK